LQRYGVAYRRETLAEWPHYALLPERVPHYWREMSWHIPEPEIAWRRGGGCGGRALESPRAGKARKEDWAVTRHRARGG